MPLRWKLHGVRYQNQVPDIILISAALVLSVVAIPLAGILVLIDSLKKIDPDIEID